MSRDNNLGMWSTGPNGGTSGLGSGPDYTDDMSGSNIHMSPNSSASILFFSLLLSLSSLLFWYATFDIHYFIVKNKL